jgi:hypothetical protein
MDKTKEEFAIFLHQAMNDHSSPAYEELYHFLVNCFVHADVNFDGKVTIDNFDGLVEMSATPPRKLGFAPKTADFYPNESVRKEARAKMFKEISKTGYISLEQWVSWATKHIGEKQKTIKDFLSGHSKDVTKAEFSAFLKKAVNKGTPESKQLYFFLLECFQEGDHNMNGAVDPVAFDKMVEAAARAPRALGLAPKTKDIFPTDAVRLSKRAELFAQMDTDHSGLISLNQWLEFAHKHIMQKVASL